MIELLESNPAKNQSLFVKIYLSTLLPYATERIIALGDVSLQEFRQMYEGFDFEQIKGRRSSLLITNVLM